MVPKRGGGTILRPNFVEEGTVALPAYDSDEYVRARDRITEGMETAGDVDKLIDRIMLLEDRLTSLQRRIDTARRYDLETTYSCGSSSDEMKRREDGDWVRWEDLEDPTP